MKNPLAAGLGLAVAALLVTAATVFAHAELQSSDPADGATIKTPYTLTATYDEELTPNGSSIVVQNASGTQVAGGTVSAADETVMTIDLPALSDGEYTVLWTAVTADDGGVTRGTYKFTVAATARSVAPSAAPTPTANAPSAEPPAVIATPAPSATPSQPTGNGSGGDLLLPLAAVVVIAAAIAGYLLYRNRRR